MNVLHCFSVSRSWWQWTQGAASPFHQSRPAGLKYREERKGKAVESEFRVICRVPNQILSFSDCN